MGYYTLPTYKPDGMRLDAALEVEVTMLTPGKMKISGDVLAVEQLHSYFTGKGYESAGHTPIGDCVSPIKMGAFNFDAHVAKDLLMQYKIGYLFFDLIIDGLYRACRYDAKDKIVER